MVFYKLNVARKILDMSAMSQMKDGDVFKKPLQMSIVCTNHHKEVLIWLSTLLLILKSSWLSTNNGTAFEYHDFDSIQSAYDLAMNYGKDSGEALSNIVDAYVLGEALNAGSTVTGGTLSTSNVLSNLTTVKKALRKRMLCLQTCMELSLLNLKIYLLNMLKLEKQLWEIRLEKMDILVCIWGIKFHVSNQLASSTVLALATQPTANDTVTIQGQVFTFVSSIGTTAGNVLIGANVDATKS